MINNAIKLSNFTLYGINQFIFDVHFVAMVYNQTMGQELKQKFNIDSYCNKIVSCFCNEKKLKSGDFYFKAEHVSNAVLKYYLESYTKDKATAQANTS